MNGSTETPGDGDGSRVVTPERESLPVLTPALRLLTSAVRVPRWFTEWHLLATALGATFVLLGGVVGWRARS